MKVCSKCKQSKPLSEFHKNRSLPGGHHYYCKPCRKSYETPLRKIHRENRKEQQKEYRKRPEVAERENARYKRYYHSLSGEKKKLYMARKRRNARHQSKQLSDGYVRGILAKKTSILPSEIPQELVDLKRVHLLIKRELCK